MTFEMGTEISFISLQFQPKFLQKEDKCNKCYGRIKRYDEKKVQKLINVITIIRP